MRNRATGTDNLTLRRRKLKDVRPETRTSSRQTLPSKPTPTYKRSTVAGFACLLCCLSLPLVLCYAVTIFSKNRLPRHRHRGGSALSPFNIKNAMQHIRQIGKRPRFVTTIALEESLEHIVYELEKLTHVAQRNGMELEIHMFRSKADTFSTSIGSVNLINSYDNMSSVVARIRPINGMRYNNSEKSLLVNAHVDSAIGAPGTNDDVVAVGINMEILRCIAEAPQDNLLLKRPVIFLFNGGEEVVLPAAHSFITQHPWASTIAAHINMESIGSGDSFHLFRLGPGSSWLAEAYARSVSVPSGTVTGTDVFNSKIIPAETDFRIFDEVGNIPGYDFVLLDNGYIYHTVHDSLEKVNEVGVCHGGDMMFELVMELAGPNDAIGNFVRESNVCRSNRLYDAMRVFATHIGLVKDPTNPRVTFFDVFHFTTIVYEEGVAATFNVLVFTFALLTWIVKLAGRGKAEGLAILRMFFVIGASVLSAAASSTFASIVYAEVLGAKLRWYGNWATAVLIFGPPASFGIVTAMLFSLPRKVSLERFDQMLCAVSTIYAFLSIAFTWNSIMSSYIPTFLLLVASLCAVQGSKVHPIIRHAQLMGVHAVLGAKLTASSFSSILPLLGRIKSPRIPHDTIAALVVTVLTLAQGGLSSLPILCHYCMHLRRLRTVLFIACFGIAASLVGILPMITGKSSKYTYSTDAPKRVSAIHFFSPQQNPKSVLWIAGQDAVSLDRARILSPLTGPEKKLEIVPTMPTWGTLRSTALETFRPFDVFFQETIIVKTDAQPQLPLPKATVLSEDELTDAWNITVQIEAPESHLLTVRLSTGSRSVVKRWSVNAEMPDHEDGAWIKHTGTPVFRFWLLIKKNESAPMQRPLVTMALSSGRLGFSRSPHVLKALSFEKWEAPSVAVSTGVEVDL